MKEITRIHIAKIAYDIELVAKKELETYMTALERYAEDLTILEDIEIRITELLQENGTTKDDVITTSDVEVLRARLGEPQDFAEDGDVATLPAATDTKPRRRLYRDQEKAVLGGVLSGVATYFGINPLWTRLGFLVLLLPSFGTMIILYAVLWIALPPARTAAEKLELEGKPVTLSAIKDRSERVVESVAINRTARTVQKMLLFCLGLLCSMVALGALLATIAAVGLGFHEQGAPIDGVFVESQWMIWLAFVLFVVSGLLFTALNTVLAIAAFSRSWTKRFSIAVVAIVIGGITAFSSGVGTIIHSQWRNEETIRQSITTTSEQLSAQFDTIEMLTVDVSEAPSIGSPTVIYTVSDGEPRAELSYPEGSVPQLDVTQDGEDATMTIALTGKQPWHHYAEPVVHIYGPELEQLSVLGGTVSYASKDSQDQLTLVAEDRARIRLTGNYEQVVAQTNDHARIVLDDAVIEDLDVSTNNGIVSAGVVRNLTVTQPDVCSSPTGRSQNDITVTAVSSNEMRYNGTVQTAESIETLCGVVVIAVARAER